MAKGLMARPRLRVEIVFTPIYDSLRPRTSALQWYYRDSLNRASRQVERFRTLRSYHVHAILNFQIAISILSSTGASDCI
jgi:hypothetical protein